LTWTYPGKKKTVESRLHIPTLASGNVGINSGDDLHHLKQRDSSVTDAFI